MLEIIQLRHVQVSVPSLSRGHHLPGYVTSGWLVGHRCKSVGDDQCYRVQLGRNLSLGDIGQSLVALEFMIY